MVIAPSSVDTNLSQLLLEASIGKIQLPEFQRDWTWDDDRIRGILASLSQGYPMGAIMRLQYGNPEIKFRYRTLEGVNDTTEAPEYLILDGQQRLTSMYQAVFGNKAVKTVTEKKVDIQRYYYLDMKKSGSNNPVKSRGVFIALQDKQDSLTFDDAPEEDSTNPVKSGGVYSALQSKQDSLTFDDEPEEGSTNPITSGGVFNALQDVQDQLTFDDTPTAGSDNPVKSGGIYDALLQKQDDLTGVPTVNRLLESDYLFLERDGAIYKIRASAVIIPSGETGEGIETENGDSLLTEDGEEIMIDTGEETVTTENGDTLLTEDNVEIQLDQ